VLYWDSFTAGTARAIIDFQDADGNSIIPPRTFDETGPNGGNALLSSNQTPVNLTLTSAHLFRIRITVGTVGNMGNAITRTIALGPSVGLGEGVPFSQSLPLRTAANYGLRWTVPDPEVWRSLDSMEIRLIDDQGEVLRLLWDETSNTFSVLNPHTGRFADPTEPGSRKRFETPWVTLLLEDTQVIGSGPAGPFVLLNLNLQFKPKASGRTFRVEAAAIDDSGNVQDFELAGTVTVSPR